ncbi:MAG: PilN domain-containing protein [Myxococcota bacterium]
MIIRVNLLPVRETQRLAELRQQGMQLLLALILTAATIGFFHSSLNDRITQTRQRVDQMQSDIDQLAPQVAWVEEFREKKAELEQKLRVIDGLEAARTGPVRILDELAIHTPDRLWLKTLETRGRALRLSGESIDNDLVAAFLRALGSSPSFESVDLESTEQEKSRDGELKLVRFSIDAALGRLQEEAVKSGSEG